MRFAHDATHNDNTVSCLGVVMITVFMRRRCEECDLTRKTLSVCVLKRLGTVGLSECTMDTEATRLLDMCTSLPAMHEVEQCYPFDHCVCSALLTSSSTLQSMRYSVGGERGERNTHSS